MKGKRFFSGAAALLLTAALPLSAFADTGDVNADESISSKDITLLQKHLAGNKTGLTAQQMQSADLNLDGKVNIFDLAILKGLLRQEPTHTGLLINEVCTSNENCLKDASGNAGDWVELYNASGSDMDISGWGLSDGKKNLYKFTFPENTIIPADGYLIVFCDDAVSEAAGEYHAPFKLSASGETVYLSHPAYGTVDSVQVPVIDTDTTYGRYANGSDSLYCLTPTPGKTNDTAQKIILVKAPVFSSESGFYDTAFDLTITSEKNTTIYYTTDGSDPAASETAQTYSQSVSIYNNTSDINVLSAIEDITLSYYKAPNYKIDKGIVIRAVAKDADGNCSDVVTKSYFVGKNASYYQDMKVISLVTDPNHLFGSDTGIYVIGDSYYEWKNSSDYKELDPWDTKNPTNYNQSGKDWERPVTMEIFENGQLTYTSDVGVRISGNGSRVAAQKSLRLYARSDYGDSKMQYAFFENLTDANGKAITSFDKVTLRNGGNDVFYTRFRDELVHKLSEGRAVSTQAAEDCIVFIDGEFWGLYSIRERMDDEYIESHYGVATENVTTLKVYETEGSETAAQEYKDFYSWAVHADMRVDENYQRVCDTIDIQSLMDYITIETYIANWDWSNPTYTNNWQMWRSNTTDPANPYADGKWRFMLYDTEYSSGMYGMDETDYTFNSIGNMCRKEEWGNLSALFYNLLNNETFREQFRTTYLEIIENNFAPEKVNAEITGYVSAMKDATAATNQRFFGWFSSLDYEKYVQEIRTFYENRPDYAKLYLEQLLSPEQTGEEMITDAES